MPTTPLMDFFGDAPPHCLIIGEIGVNHNGRLDLAMQMIDAAAKAGADAVKFQTFTAENLVTRTAIKAKYQNENDPRDESQRNMLKRLELAREDLLACHAHCEATGIAFLSTPFDADAADLLENVGVQAYKVSSGDLTNLPLLSHIAAKGLPTILSTGMATLADIEDAVALFDGVPLAILHCVSDYPAAPEEANLRAMATIRTAFGRPVGWSDHTLGEVISAAAVAMGARVIEKHFTLDKEMEGPDHKASLSVPEFKSFVRNIRTVEKALGNGIKRPQPSEHATANIARRSIVSARDIKLGETLTRDDLVMKRPGTGFMPKNAEWIVGRTAKRDIPSDSVLHLDDIS